MAENDTSKPAVLVLDDDELARSVMVNMLELKGYTVLESASPLHALDLLRSRAKIDLIITDVHMPGGLSGSQFVKMARSARPHIKVLYATGYADELLEDLSTESETQIMEKPFHLNAFLTKVSTMLTTR